MTEQEIKSLVESQKKYFRSGATLDYSVRKGWLIALRHGINKYETALSDALKTDLGKSVFEGYVCEIGLTLSKITWTLKHLKSLMADKRYRMPLVQFHSKCFSSATPYGTVLIMSPWNYPVLLTLEPLIYAVAAGNTVILKPSAYAPAVSQVLCEMISEIFPAELVSVVKGGRDENQSLLSQKFDFIFFTGGKVVGKVVLKHAAEYLTPVILELGGKSPCIIDASANIELAARRVVFGKYLNCGQTCVAPDYILCHKSVKEAFINAVKEEITRQFSKDPINNPGYGKIITRKHFDRILGLIDENKVVYGGASNLSTLQIAPTVMDGVTFDDKVMSEEIFGPVMPIIEYDDLESIISYIEDNPHPLALYLFTNDKAMESKVMKSCHFGGGCINDTMIHLATDMPFGGVGESGMGSYHNEAGFEAFTHRRSIVDKKNWIDLSIRYQPYSTFKEKLVRMVMR